MCDLCLRVCVLQAIDLPERFHYVVIFVTGETTQEPVNLEEDRCDGWEWVKWDSEVIPLLHAPTAFA
jgi:hypothetical protein